MPTCSYSTLLCSEYGTDVKVTLNTSELEDNIYWKIESKDYNRIIMASESNLKPLRSYSQLKCLAYGTHKFIVNYEENSTLVSNVSYSLKAADKPIFNDSTNDYIDFEEEFTICRSNSDCIDFDGCSTDICNQETNICENKLNNLTDCSNCN